MAWKFPWSKTDPITRKQKELEAEAARLAEEARILEEEVAALTRPEPVPEEAAPAVPVWTDSDEDGIHSRYTRTRPVNVRVLEARRRRDRNLFILLASVLIAIILWLVFR